MSDVLEGARDVELGQAATQGAWPNPQLSYLRAQTFGPQGTGEDYLSISQVFDLGNRRGLRREASLHQAAVVGHESAAARALLVAEVRQRFYETIYRQRRMAALRSWDTRIDEVLSVVTRREANGDDAPYDRRRIERERGVARARAEVELASLERAAARLWALAGRPVASAAPLLAGELLPDEPPSFPLLRASSTRWPKLLALDEGLNAAHRLARSGALVAHRAVRRGAIERVVPILMTALAAGLGLLPLAMAGGEPGSEIQAPMAVVILCGLAGSLALNVFVVPAFYLRFGAAGRA